MVLDMLTADICQTNKANFTIHWLCLLRSRGCAFKEPSQTYLQQIVCPSPFTN